ncbi:50S ribosomal protein L28 [Abditibacteriota bacterium]|nr:50S ribosomal protein L28 [Abditibacteriota bacterium]
MSRRCEITGKKPLTGNLVSHSMRHTKHRQMPNLQTKRIWVPEEGRFIKMKISTRALKAMSRNGVAATIAKAKRKGILA